jgi:hypothetical protein
MRLGVTQETALPEASTVANKRLYAPVKLVVLVNSSPGDTVRGTYSCCMAGAKAVLTKKIKKTTRIAFIL